MSTVGALGPVQDARGRAAQVVGREVPEAGLFSPVQDDAATEQVWTMARPHHSRPDPAPALPRRTTGSPGVRWRPTPAS